jgi:hypothetical protein
MRIDPVRVVFLILAMALSGHFAYTFWKGLILSWRNAAFGNSDNPLCYTSFARNPIAYSFTMIIWGLLLIFMAAVFVLSGFGLFRTLF